MSKLRNPNTRKGTRSYDERKAMYDEGTDVVRPQMLVTVWNEKFAAWLQENPDQEWPVREFLTTCFDNLL